MSASIASLIDGTPLAPIRVSSLRTTTAREPAPYYAISLELSEVTIGGRQATLRAAEWATSSTYYGMTSGDGDEY